MPQPSWDLNPPNGGLPCSMGIDWLRGDDGRLLMRVADSIHDWVDPDELERDLVEAGQADADLVALVRSWDDSPPTESQCRKAYHLAGRCLDRAIRATTARVGRRLDARRMYLVGYLLAFLSHQNACRYNARIDAITSGKDDTRAST